VRKDRPPRLEMPLEEAQRFSTNAADGLLDTSDPDVARVVAQANRVVVRAGVWGRSDDRAERRWWRLGLIGAVVFLAIWVAGLLVPLLSALGSGS
jgi:hypothetical protein